MSRDLIDALRVLRIELQIANERVATRAGLNPRDLDVLDVIDRDGPCTPTYLARRTGLRAATLTGVLARLRADGWVAGEVDPADARSTRFTATERFDELRNLYRQGDHRVAALAESLSVEQQEAIATFLLDVATSAAQESTALTEREP